MIETLKPYPVMKDSGLPWLGEVPEHWTEKRAKYFYREADERSVLGDEELLSVSHKTGVTPRKQSVTMFLAESTVGYKICRPGDVAINTMWAFMGAMGVARQVGLVSPAYGVYRPHKADAPNPDYLDRLLRIDAYKSEYTCRSTGINSSRLRLYPDEFLRIPIICPPPTEQAAIVRFLDHADRKIRRYIRAKQKLIKLLEEQKQVIIHRAVTRGLDPDVRLKPSGVEWLGDIPEHWQVKRLHQVTDPNRAIMYGIVLPGPNVDNGVYIVKGGNCEPGRLRPELLSRTTFDIEARYARSRLAAWDIVFAIRGGVGAAELVPQEIAGANLTQDAARIAAGGGIDPRWLLLAVRAPIFQEHVQSQVVGATVRGVNIRDLKRIELVVPPAEEQSQIVAFLGAATEDVVTAMGRARYEVDLLHEYRTRLIADVVTGKLDVREAAAKLTSENQENPPIDEWDDISDAEEAGLEDLNDALEEPEP